MNLRCKSEVDIPVLGYEPQKLIHHREEVRICHAGRVEADVEEGHPLTIIFGEACFQPRKTYFRNNFGIHISGMEHLRDRDNQEREIPLLLVITLAGMIRHADTRQL